MKERFLTRQKAVRYEKITVIAAEYREDGERSAMLSSALLRRGKNCPNSYVINPYLGWPSLPSGTASCVTFRMTFTLPELSG